MKQVTEVGAALDEGALSPADEARAAVHVGLWTSATRCVLSYVVAPVAGAFGILLGPLGLVLQCLGAVTATAGARRLWILRHRARFAYVGVATAIDLFVVLTLAQLTIGVLR